MNKLFTPRFFILVGIVLIAALSRITLLGLSMPNFSPVGAMALFGGAYFARRSQAVFVTIISLWISDIALNYFVYREYFSGLTWLTPNLWSFGCIALIVLIGRLLYRKVSITNVALGSLAASVIFFLVSNFGVWLGGTMYPQTLSGLGVCYVAGLPFFKNTLLSDALFSGILFGAFQYAQARLSVLTERI